MINNNKFITSILPWDGGAMVELNNLGKALMIQPEKFGDKMSQLFSSQNYYADNPISSIALKNGAKKIVTSNEWEWKLSTSNTAPTTVVEDLEKTNDKPGLGRTTFKIKLRDNWFKSTDVITPGTADQKYQCRIMEEPQRHGTNGWVYTVRIVSDDFSTFLPKMFLKAGTKWAKLYSTAGEADIKGGSTQFSAPITLKNSLGKLRKEYHVTDYALEQVLAVKLPTQTGKLADFWINYAEVEYWKQWYREIERAYWYNRKAKSIQTDAGRPVDSFAGIFEQLESANNHYYTDLTAELIENFMMDIFYARVKPGKGRSMKVFTGEYGMLIFSRAMQDLMEKRGWRIANNNFNPVQKTSSEYNTNAYSYGYQFVKYIMHNGAELELVHLPLLDDININMEIDPISGYPVQSQRFIFLDFSGTGTESNIQIVEKKNGYKFGYVCGMVGPFGPVNGGQMAHSGEYYSMHVSKELGIHIEDTSKCGQLILKRNFGY